MGQAGEVEELKDSKSMGAQLHTNLDEAKLLVHRFAARLRSFILSTSTFEVLCHYSVDLLFSDLLEVNEWDWFDVDHESLGGYYSEHPELFQGALTLESELSQIWDPFRR